MRSLETSRIAVTAIAALFASLILVHFYDISWFAPDDAFYADIAQRILKGERLHSQIQDIRPGYVHYINATGMAVFGENLAALRATLACFLVLVAGAIAFRIGGFRGLLASIAVIAIGPIIFMNPSASWYSLVIALALAIWLSSNQSWLKPKPLLAVGFLVGLCFFMRQLSGAFLAVGVCLALANIQAHENDEGDGFYSIAAIGVFIVIAGYFLAVQSTLTPLILFGIAPLVLAWKCRKSSASYRQQMIQAISLTIGAALSGFPLAVTQLASGDLSRFVQNVFILPFTVPKLDFISESSFELLFFDATAGFIRASLDGNISGLAACVAILGLILAAPALGCRIAFSRPTKMPGDRTFSIIALCFAITSAHFPSIIYLSYTAPFVFAAHLMLASPDARRAYANASIVFILSIASLVGLAGRPITKTMEIVVSAPRIDHRKVTSIPQLQLRIPAQDAQNIGLLIEKINQSVDLGEPIFVYPANSELYFLSNGVNNFPFYYAVLGLRTCNDLQILSNLLTSEDGPKLIIHADHKKYETELTRALTLWLQAEFTVDWETDKEKAYKRPQSQIETRPICL